MKPMRMALIGIQILLFAFMACSRQSNPSVNSKTLPSQPSRTLTEEEAFQFSMELQEAFNSQDLDLIDELVNLLRISKAALNDSGLPREALEIYYNTAARKSVMESALNKVIDGASYHFLRIKERNGSFHPLFRMVLEDGSVAYHEFRLTIDSSNNPVALDVYFSATGEWLSESNRRLFVDQTKAILKRSRNTDDTTESIIADGQKVQQMMQAYRNKTGQREALESFRELPDSLRNDKAIQIVAIALAKSVDVTEYRKEIQRILENYPDDLAADIQATDFYVTEGQIENALASLQRLDKQVGGDPYLHAIRARAYNRCGKQEEAKNSLRLALAECTDVIQVMHIAIELGLEWKDFDAVANVFRTLVEDWDSELDFTVIETEEVYREFIHSDPYKSLKDWFTSLP